MAVDEKMLGQRYERALFEFADDRKELPQIKDDMVLIKHVFDQNPELGDLLSGVTLERDKKDELFKTLSQDFSNTTKHFLQIVYQGGNMAYIGEITSQFIAHFNRSQGIQTAVATTAVPLTSQQADALSQQLQKRLNAKKVELNNQVDPTIIGGVIVRVNDMLIDGSVKNQLKEIHRQLKQG